MLRKLYCNSLIVFATALGVGGIGCSRDQLPKPSTATANDSERELYLTPGGLYTEADIEANDRMTASERFVAFKAKHDLHPHVGDRICPITRTKANPECAWVIGGSTYEFCCPPCVDEFVKLAKENPEAIKAPEKYVK